MLQGLLQHGCFLYQAQKESLSLQGGKGSSRKSFHLIKLGRPIILCSSINPKLTDLGPEAYLHLCHILVARSKSPLLLTTRGRGPHNAKDTKQQESWKLPQGLPTCPRLQISSVHLRMSLFSFFGEKNLVALGPYSYLARACRNGLFTAPSGEHLPT